MTLPEPASAPCSRPDPTELLDAYIAYLRARGRRVWKNSIGPARAFLRRWPDPADFAAEPLDVRLAMPREMFGFVAFLLVRGRLRPGYDYLIARKFSRLWREFEGTPLAADVERFADAAAELGFGIRTRAGMACQVAARLLVQTGKRLDDLCEDDVACFEAAIAEIEERTGRQLHHYTGSAYCARAVLYHLGILPEAPSRLGAARQSWGQRMAEVPEPLHASFVTYLERLAGTQAPGTLTSRATRLAHFGRFLAHVDPALRTLADLDRRPPRRALPFGGRRGPQLLGPPHHHRGAPCPTFRHKPDA